MRNQLLLLLFICCSCAGPEGGPSPIRQMEKPSLNQLALALNEVPDEEDRMWIYWKMYRQLKVQDDAQALSHLDDLEKLAISLGDDEYIGKANFGKGHVASTKNYHSQAISYYITAINHLSKTSKSLMMADAFHNIGGIFVKVGEFGSAVDYFRKALSIYEDANDWEFIARTKYGIGTCYAKSSPDNAREAERYFDEVITLVSEKLNNDSELLFDAYTYKGRVANCLSDEKKALDNYHKTLHFADSPEERAMVYNFLGHTHMVNGDYEASQKWLTKGLAEDPNSALCLITSGELMQKVGNHEAALRFFEKCIVLADKDVINGNLKEAISLANQSHQALLQSGISVDGQRVVELMKVQLAQDKLASELEKKLSNSNLKDVLSLKTENTDLRNEVIKLDFLKTNLIMVVGFLILVSFVAFWRDRAAREKNRKAIAFCESNGY